MWQERVETFVNATRYFIVRSALVDKDCRADIVGCLQDDEGDFATALRSFARTAYYAPFVSSQIKRFLQATAVREAEACKGEGSSLTCGYVLKNEGQKPAQISVGEGSFSGAFAALSAVQALLYEDSFRNKTANPGGETKTNGGGGGGGKKNGAGGLGVSLVTVILATSLVVFGLYA